MKTKLILLSALLLIGCSGTRNVKNEKTDVTTKEDKTEKVTEKETTETKVDTNIKEVTETKVDTEKNVVTETKTIKPIDATKKSVYKGLEFENAEINETKTTDLSKEKTISVSKYELLQKAFENKAKEVSKLFKENKELKARLKDKATESKKGNFWNIVLLIICIALFLYGFYYYVIWSRKIVKDKEKLNL
jgi:hypothetical protein